MVKALVFGFAFLGECLSTRDCVFESYRGRVFFLVLFLFCVLSLEIDVDI